MLHGDICMIIGDAQIVNAHDVAMLQACDDFIFLQESIETDDTFGHVGDLTEYLEHDQSARALAFSEVDLAHTTAANLPDVPMATDHDGAEAVPLPVIRLTPPYGLHLFTFAGCSLERSYQRIAVDFSAVN